MTFGESDEEDDNEFHDAMDFIQLHSFKKSVVQPAFLSNSAELLDTYHTPNNDSFESGGSADDEPLEREQLPWLKDPNAKVSIWAIIKDSVGKDLSKMSVPVFFNDPTSLL